MRDSRESDYDDNNHRRSSRGGRQDTGRFPHDDRMEKILELNVAIYQDIFGVAVSADSFRL